MRFRRRVSENNNEELKFGMRSRCVSTPQSLNRSIPCTYESSQFTGVRSASYIDDLSEHSISSKYFHFYFRFLFPLRGKSCLCTVSITLNTPVISYSFLKQLITSVFIVIYEVVYE